ncbi:unnamed protein product [Rotaria magnacalcarata]
MNRRSLCDQSLLSPTRTKRVPNVKSGNLHDHWTVICYMIGLINILSAVWMLIAPEHWYYNLPVGVPESGPLNIHLIRDIGCTFLVLGFGLLAGGFYFI